MRTVTLTEAEEEGFFEGSDGAFYTPVERVEARCAWCRRGGHPAGLYFRQVLFTAEGALVCGRHVRREDWREVA